MQCKRETDGREFDRHTLQTIRQQAIKAVNNGLTVNAVAQAFGVNIRTVFRWLSDYACGGQNALLGKTPPGAKPKLDPDQMNWLANTIRDKNPQQLRFVFALWTLPIIGELIHRQFGLRLSKPTISRVMKLLGFTPQRPLYRAWQQDTVWVEKWRAEEFPRLQAEAKQAGALVYFADEAGIRSDYHAGTTWAPCGETPVVQATGRRFGLNMISAVSGRGDFRFMVHEGSVTAKVFLEFVKRLAAGSDRPVYLVVDGHPIHKAKIVSDYVKAQDGRLKLIFLPPYSPALNPDEQVWGYVKPRVAKQLPQNMEALKALTLGALRRLQKLPETVQSFFLHPDCRYAAI
jgi:transposase